MNQALLLELLQRVYKCGDHSFLTVKQITMIAEKDYNCNGIKNIKFLIHKLYAWGYLDINDNSGWYNRGYRVKEKVLSMKLISPLDKDITADEQKRLI